MDFGFGTMLFRQRWLLVFALVLTMWGQFTYACVATEMPPQSVCCCDESKADCDISASGVSSVPCCAVDYQSAVEDAVPISINADEALAGLSGIALVHWPYLDPLLALPSSTSPPDPDWLLTQAESGRTVYLSTLRLRI